VPAVVPEAVAEVAAACASAKSCFMAASSSAFVCANSGSTIHRVTVYETGRVEVPGACLTVTINASMPGKLLGPCSTL
jgi:hypothetical protein